MTRLIVGRFDDIENARGALSALAAEEVESHEYGLFFVTQPGMHDIYPIGGDAHSDQGARQGGGGAMKGAGLGGATGLAIGAFAAVVPVVSLYRFPLRGPRENATRERERSNAAAPGGAARWTSNRRFRRTTRYRTACRRGAAAIRR
jgi:hypothetical protein